MNLAAVATAAGIAFALGRLVSRHEIVAARREASTDGLTGLTNRAGLMHQLHERTNKNLRYTVLLLDLNGFKPVNDTHGHRAGDELLVALAGRLRADFAGHAVARLGGDEFVLVLDGLYPAELVQVFAAGVQRTVARPVRLTGVAAPVSLSAAVGAAAARHRESPRSVLHAADQAMYRSKLAGVPCLQSARTAAAVSESPKVRRRDVRHVRVA